MGSSRNLSMGLGVVLGLMSAVGQTVAEPLKVNYCAVVAAPGLQREGPFDRGAFIA
jgi:hypothetical protein